MSAVAPLTDDELFAQLDQTFASVPAKPKPERPWLCLAGEAPSVCGHVQISRSTNDGLTDVVCLSCGHEWLIVEALS